MGTRPHILPASANELLFVSCGFRRRNFRRRANNIRQFRESWVNCLHQLDSGGGGGGIPSATNAAPSEGSTSVTRRAVKKITGREKRAGRAEMLLFQKARRRQKDKRKTLIDTLIVLTFEKRTPRSQADSAVFYCWHWYTRRRTHTFVYTLTRG